MAIKEPKIPAKREREPEYIEKPSPFSIEGIRSGAVQSKIVKAMIVLSGLIMAGTFAISSLNPTGVPQNGPNGGSTQSPDTTVATVGSQTVSAGQLENSFARTVGFNTQYGFGARPDALNYFDLKQTELKQLTDNAALVEAAQKANISASDAEIDAEIDKQLRASSQFKPSQGQTQAAFLRQLQTQYKVNSVDEAIAKRKGEITAEGREGVRKTVMVNKLEKTAKDAATSTEDDYKRSVTKLDLYQILLRPELPKGNAKDFKAEIARLQTANADKANKLFAQLKANPTLANFKTIATKQSADAATKAKGGALGLKLPNAVSTPEIGEAMAKAAGPLAGPFKNELSGEQTIYFIAGRKTELPKDFAKNKKKLLADFETAQDNTAWQKKQEELQKAVTPEVSDAALAAYQLQTKDLFSKTGDEQKKVREDVLSRYDDALKTAGNGLEAAAINYQKSTLYRDMGQKEPQLAALKAATETAKSDPNLLLTYARALSDAGQPKVALEQLKAAAKAQDDATPTPPSMFGAPNPDDQVRGQLAAMFDALKEPKLAAEQRAKVKPAAPGGMGGMMGGLPPGVKIVPGK